MRITSFIRVAISARGIFLIFGPKAMFSATVMCGNSP